MPHVIPFPGEFIAGVAVFLIVVWDAFGAILFPRPLTRRFRITRLFYKTTWRTWKFLVSLVPRFKTREALLGFYGPMSLILLIGVWAVGLVVGFGLMQYGSGSALIINGQQPGFWTDLYM